GNCPVRKWPSAGSEPDLRAGVQPDLDPREHVGCRGTTAEKRVLTGCSESDWGGDRDCHLRARPRIVGRHAAAAGRASGEEGDHGALALPARAGSRPPLEPAPRTADRKLASNPAGRADLTYLTDPGRIEVRARVGAPERGDCRHGAHG